ncbi:DUF1127 domain-containing protein [Roseicitreum antarcticum]|uniref:DUF1127 domain-containing protein n=1 Tax=Roseicitreum antarcticum TaxID=564137 RepID=UPI00115FF636
MWFETVWKLIRLWANRHTQRRELARMEAHHREDIGRTLPEVRRECKKWFWQK